MPKIHSKHGSMVKAFHDYAITVNKVYRRFIKLKPKVLNVVKIRLISLN